VGSDAPTSPATPAPRPPREASTAVLDNGDSAGRSARRAASRRRNRKRAAIVGILALLLAAGGAAFALSGGGGEKTVALSAKRKVAPTTTTTKPKFQSFITLTSNVDQLKAYASPDEASQVVGTFSKTTDYKQPRTLLALNTQGDWFQALLPMRPPTSSYKDGEPMGWVKATDVIPASTDYEIHISVSQHSITLLKQGQPVVGPVGVVVGKDSTPTPIGKFYITDPVDLQSRPNGAYGAYALGLSAYSEVLKTFNGGPGQIAIHGNGQLNTVGQNLSNGCIRLFNNDILEIAKTVPLGTPVIIQQ
jgi:lipoprotein-anchoring transpeptidase ErfK/SrfK